MEMNGKIATLQSSRPRYKLCWWCNQKFRGSTHRTRTVDGNEVLVHVRCAAWLDEDLVDHIRVNGFD